MLLLLYSLCGVMLGFIIGHSYGWEKRGLQSHGRSIDNWAFIRRLIYG